VRLGGLGKPNVRRLRRKRRLDGLHEALRYGELVADDDGVEWDVGVPVRVEAAEALADFEPGDVSADLAEALGDPVPAVRIAVIETLAKLGTPTAVEPLVDCAIGWPDGDGEVAQRALELLVSWELEGTPQVMVERLLEPGSPPLAEDEHRDALERLLGADPRGADARDAVADQAVGALRDPDDERTEGRAETILGWLGPSVADRVLGPLSDGGVSPALIRAAGLLGDARIVEPVIGRLSSDDPEMRRSAASAAGALNHTLAVPALLAATQDAEQPVRDAASAALNRMGMAAVIAGLAEIVRGQGAQALPQAIDGQALESGGPVVAAQVLTKTREALAAGGLAAGARAAAAPAQQVSALPEARPARRGGLVDRLFGRTRR